MTDASGRDVAEVFFDHDPIAGDLILRELLQQGVEFVDGGDQRLAPASRSEWLFYPDATTAQHTSRCHARIAGTERAIATQYDVAHPLRECRRPALRPLSVITDERVTDRFRFHERLRNRSSELLTPRDDASSRSRVSSGTK